MDSLYFYFYIIILHNKHKNLSKFGLQYYLSCCHYLLDVPSGVFWRFFVSNVFHFIFRSGYQFKNKIFYTIIDLIFLDKNFMRFLAFFIVSFVSFLKINKNILKKLSSQIFLKKNNCQTIKQKYGLRSDFFHLFFSKMKNGQK